MTTIPRTGKDIKRGDLLLRYQDGKEVFAHIYGVEPLDTNQVGLTTSLGHITLYKRGVYSISAD